MGLFSGIGQVSLRSDRVSENLSTPEGKKLLERLKRLHGDDVAQQLKYLPGGPSKDDSDPNVMQQRFAHRKVCATLFEEFIFQTEVSTDPSAPDSRHRQLDQQNAVERWKWLDRFEREIILDRNFLEDSNDSYRAYTRLMRERQITTWIKEVECRQKRWLQAIKLVLKFKSDEQTRRVARAASLMDRVTSMVPELMLKVVEACVKSQFGHWNVQKSTVLSELADKCFEWPDSVTDNTRDILKLEAANALIKVGIVQITMKISAQNTMVVPPLLVERQNDLRRLALDLHTTPVDGRNNRELNRGIKVMPSLGTHFPNMKVFVLSLYFHCRTGADDSLKHEALNMRNLRRTDDGSGWEQTTIKDTTIDLVQAFAESAPRTRKLIRFGNVAADDDTDPRVGPLVEISRAATQAFEEAAVIQVDDSTTGEQNSARTEARRIFDQAYRAPRVVRVRQARAVSSFPKRPAIENMTVPYVVSP